MTLIPATGTDVSNGVIKINLNINVKDVSYSDVGNLVTTKLENIKNNVNKDLDFETRFYILPNEVEFFGAAAWASMGGDTVWMKSRYSNSVMAQVHEYGHCLGLHHSGKDDNPYGDATGYMGNKLSWGDDGDITCFNPA